MLWITTPAGEPSYLLLYHWSGSGLSLSLPVLFDLVLGTLAWTLIFALAETRPIIKDWLWLVITALLPFFTLKSWGLYRDEVPDHTLSRALLLLGLTACLLMVLLRRKLPARSLANLGAFTSTILLFTGISSLLLFGRLVCFSWETRHVPAARWTGTPFQADASPNNGPLVLWIIFDELSYRQLFEHRFPGLQLPAFDRLETEATVFTNVRPAGYLTEDAIPSLISGIPIDAVRSTPESALFIHHAGIDGWHSFQPVDTVFQDAENDRYETVVVGWYNPYCRVLATVLNHCFWTNSAPLSNGMTPATGLLGNMLAPWHVVLGTGVPYAALSVIRHFPSLHARDAALHARDLRLLTAAADQALATPSRSLILLHFPVPHPPGISRAEPHLAAGPATYLDNLALADQVLAHIRSTLERQGRWESTTLVVMGDHSWRIPMWRPTPNWSQEEESASGGGVFDTRPAYLLKFSDQTHGTVISTPFPALRTRSLLDGLLSGTLSASNLPAWVRLTK